MHLRHKELSDQVRNPKPPTRGLGNKVNAFTADDKPSYSEAAQPTATVPLSADGPTMLDLPKLGSEYLRNLDGNCQATFQCSATRAAAAEAHTALRSLTSRYGLTSAFSTECNLALTELDPN